MFEYSYDNFLKLNFFMFCNSKTYQYFDCSEDTHEKSTTVIKISLKVQKILPGVWPKIYLQVLENLLYGPSSLEVHRRICPSYCVSWPSGKESIRNTYEYVIMSEEFDSMKLSDNPRYLFQNLNRIKLFTIATQELKWNFFEK